MMDLPRDLLFPHYCCSCGVIGAVLCEYCKYDIVSEPNQSCIACLGPTARSGSCSTCKLPYSAAWMVGMRRDGLDKLVSASKFGSIRAGCDEQAGLIDGLLPHLPRRTVIVPVPTIAKHVRQRGYGHAERIARGLARRRRVEYQPVVRRRVQYVQHGADRKTRRRQAAESYVVTATLDSDTTYLVIDDVYTTGFTMHYIAQALREAGAGDIWVAVTSRQPPS